jgi:hypothetical protein
VPEPVHQFEAFDHISSLLVASSTATANLQEGTFAACEHSSSVDAGFVETYFGWQSGIRVEKGFAINQNGMFAVRDKVITVQVHGSHDVS